MMGGGGANGGAGGDVANPAGKPKILFVSGSNHHDWMTQDPYLINILRWSQVFESVEYMIMPAASDDASWEAWRPAWTDYDAIVHNLDLAHGNFGRDWPDEVKADFEDYMQNGGGMASLHAGTHGWPDWVEYNKMTGGGWRDASFGCSVEIVNGQKVIVPQGVGPAAADVPFTDQLVRVLDLAHPITQGLPPVWKIITDNSSVYQRGPCESVNVLDYAYSQTGDGIDGYFPVSWTNQYHQGRFFFTAPMHVMSNSTIEVFHEMDDVGFQTMWIRGVEWAATGMVSYPVPENFPTETTVSRNDLSTFQEP
jgi:type 1 glutamine amidotransferase